MFPWFHVNSYFCERFVSPFIRSAEHVERVVSPSVFCFNSGPKGWYDINVKIVFKAKKNKIKTL